MARELLTVPGPPEQVYVVRFRNVKGWWVIVEGDPTDKRRWNFLGALKLHRGFKQVGETYYSGGSADEIVELRERPNTFIGAMDRPTRLNPEVAPDDKES